MQAINLIFFCEGNYQGTEKIPFKVSHGIASSHGITAPPSGSYTRARDRAIKRFNGPTSASARPRARSHAYALSSDGSNRQFMGGGSALRFENLLDSQNYSGMGTDKVIVTKFFQLIMIFILT